VLSKLSTALRSSQIPRMRNIRVATTQFQHAPGDIAYNMGRVRHFVTEAARSKVEIIAFPEMCLTGYWHVRNLSREGVEALAEAVPEGPSTQELLRLSKQHGMTIGAGLIERAEDGRLYNGYVVAMPNGDLALHRKLHEHRRECAGHRARRRRNPARTPSDRRLQLGEPSRDEAG